MAWPQRSHRQRAMLELSRKCMGCTHPHPQAAQAIIILTKIKTRQTLKRSEANDSKPKIPNQRSNTKDAKPRIPSQRSQAKALMRKIQRQRPQAKDLKSYHQKCNTKDPKLKIQSPGFQDMQRPQESLHRVTLAIAIYYIYRLNIYIHILQYVRDACMFARVLV